MSLAILFVLACFVFCGYIENHYTRKATVYTVENNIITFIDEQGNYWKWEEEEESFVTGESVKLRMFNNYTINEITDDVIIKVVKTNIDK